MFNITERRIQRKEIKDALTSLGLNNEFTVKTIGFSDLGRDSVSEITVKGWKPSPQAAQVKEVLKPYGIVDFAA